jgi:hypothetical protein
LNDGEAIEEARLKSGLKIDLSQASEDDAILVLEELREKFPRVVREFVAEQMQELNTATRTTTVAGKRGAALQQAGAY